MTTITVARKGGQIAIAADRLTTFGDTRLSSAYEANAKIFRVRDTWIGIAGSSAHHHVIEHAFRKVDAPAFGSKVEIFDTMVRLHPLLKEHFFLNPKEEDDDPYESSQYVMLMANAGGIYGVYSYREVFSFDRYWAIGSGRAFALGAMYAAWGRARSGREVASIGAAAGCEFDKNSGGPVVVRTVKAKPTGSST
ncbi:MAG: MFS transporter [Burkholderiales bacterium]|nr:MFS transporter [Burkholderiales bacterium]